MRRENGTLGLILGGIVAVGTAVFILSGGIVGKTTINSDADLPPIATTGQK